MAKKKIYPTLWMLFRDRLIPDETFIYGYSRSKLTLEQLKTNVAPYLKVRLLWFDAIHDENTVFCLLILLIFKLKIVVQ